MTISLIQCAVFLGAAVLAVSVFRLLRLSSILGYVAAGMVIGPWGLRLVSDVPSVMSFAEFGIVLLLFVIGLELQPTRLWVMRRIVFGLGFAQVISSAVLLGAAGWLLGLPAGPALLIGFGLSLSSTPLVLQLLAERHQLKSPHGRAAFGILLFQDLAVLPALAALPLIAPTVATSASQSNGMLTLARLLAVMAAIVIGGRLVLRPALRVVARINVSEVFTAAALLTVIVTAILARAVGLSMSLGAFLAGVLLADSEFRHELEADLEPFKGLLLGLFFVAVGMAANLGLLESEPLRVLAVTSGFLAIKVVAVTALGRLAGQSRKSALKLGFALPAGGEFAFVLFTLAAREQIIDAETADLLVLSVTLSMMFGPLLLILLDAYQRRWAAEPIRPFDGIDERENRVIIAGFGRFGQIVARVLTARHVKFTALDSNQTHVDFVRRFGNEVYYGDASRLDLLRAAGAATATVFVLAIDDVDASLRTADLVRDQFPKLKVLARARSRQHAFALRDRGVRYIIRETYVSSLEMAATALEALGETTASARAAVRRFRLHDEATLEAQYQVKDDESKFIATSREAAKQLERLFAADEAEANAPGETTQGASNASRRAAKREISSRTRQSESK
jgi:monovalent cation:proton antiporter-2 (CPA2) family protein